MRTKSKSNRSEPKTRKNFRRTNFLLFISVINRTKRTKKKKINKNFLIILLVFIVTNSLLIVYFEVNINMRRLHIHLLLILIDDTT